MAVVLIGEDLLCCALGERLVKDVLGVPLAREPINTGGRTQLEANLGNYAKRAGLGPVLCIADSDGRCVKSILDQKLTFPRPPSFALRYAVAEAECWIMADTDTFAAFLGVSSARLSRNPEQLPDPKAALLALAGTSRHRRVRDRLVSPMNPAKPSAEYNLTLRDYILKSWRQLKPRVLLRASIELSER